MATKRKGKDDDQPAETVRADSRAGLGDDKHDDLEHGHAGYPSAEDLARRQEVASGPGVDR
jgi:hypothetical protein